MGNATDRYPLVVKVEPLPPDVPTTGRTKSTWDREDTRQQPLTNEEIFREAGEEEFDEDYDDGIPF
jgi:hypothetical protein